MLSGPAPKYRRDWFFVCSTRPQHLGLEAVRAARVAESPDHNLAGRLVATVGVHFVVVVDNLEVAEHDETALAELPKCPSEDHRSNGPSWTESLPHGSRTPCWASRWLKIVECATT